MGVPSDVILFSGRLLQFIHFLLDGHVSHRSTKGASKARRDHINHEIRNMRALLPISQEDQERLSYLHSMAATCTYIRKSVLFQGKPSHFTSSSFVSFRSCPQTRIPSTCNQSQPFLSKDSWLVEILTPPSHTRSFFRPCMASSWSPPFGGNSSMYLTMCLTISAFRW